jgi:hypothetical protein
MGDETWLDDRVLDSQSINPYRALADAAQCFLPAQPNSQSINRYRALADTAQWFLRAQPSSSSSIQNVMLWGIPILEVVACKLIDSGFPYQDHKKFITWDVVSTAHDNNWQKFLGKRAVAMEVEESWWRCPVEFCFLKNAPVFRLLKESNSTETNRFIVISPKLIHDSRAFSYFVFLFLLFLNLLIGPPLGKDFSVLEWIIFVYFLALFVVEVQRTLDLKPVIYLKSWNSQSDILILLLFLCYFTARFLSTLTTSEDVRMKALRISSYFMGYATLLAYLRSLSYLLPLPKIGPMIASFLEIREKAFGFLAVLIIFFLAFSLGATGIYQATRYTNSADHQVNR